MKHLFKIALCCLWFFIALPVEAQSSRRLYDLAAQLERSAASQAGADYNEYRRGGRGRSDVDALFASQQFSTGASLFRRMLTDRSSAADLQDALRVLQNQARRFDRNDSSRNLWGDIRRTLDDISRELGGRYGDDDRDRDRDDDGNYRSGGMIWRGRVDDQVEIEISGQRAVTRVVAGKPYYEDSYTFDEPLPRSAVVVEVQKKKGRGDVRVVQQPSSRNGFRAIVQIRDSSGGAADYEFELTWR